MFWQMYTVVGLLLLLSRFSHVRLCATPQMAAHQAPLSLGFLKQEYWGGLPFPSSMHASTHAKSLQSCPTLCNPIDGRPPGSPVPGILQARTLEWVAISFSNARKWKVKVKSLSCNRLLASPWTAAYQALPSMGFSRQEYWSGCRCLLLYHNKYVEYFCRHKALLLLSSKLPPTPSSYF